MRESPHQGAGGGRRRARLSAASRGNASRFGAAYARELGGEHVDLVTQLAALCCAGQCMQFGEQLMALDPLYASRNPEVKGRFANLKGKVKRAGRGMGRRSDIRKAFVCLKPGQEINFVDGGGF